MQTNIYFDIETCALSDSEIEVFKPQFEPAKNLKDPDKIKLSIAEKEAAWKEELALSPLTGRVLCIGVSGQPPIAYGDEAQMLVEWWGTAVLHLQAGNRLVGFYCRTFDVPFLIRRSFRHGIRVPSCIWEGRYLTSSIVDVADLWACGGRDPRDRISLDTLSQFLGVGVKNGDGKDFAALWRTDKSAALKYLDNDLALTKAAYERMTIP